MKELIITWLLNTLFSVTKEQWNTVLGWVETAAGKFTEGKIKNQFVRDNITKLWPSMKTHVVDALTGIAIAWQKKLGKA
jgi:hypothetical protein